MFIEWLKLTKLLLILGSSFVQIVIRIALSALLAQSYFFLSYKTIATHFFCSYFAEEQVLLLSIKLVPCGSEPVEISLFCTR